MHKVSDRQIGGFLDFLLAQGAVREEGVQRVRAALRSSGQPFDVVVTELGLLKEADLPDFFSRAMDLPVADEFDVPLIADLLQGLGFDYAQEHAILPIRLTDQNVALAMANPFDRDTLDVTAYFFDRDHEVYVVARSKLNEIWEAARLHLAAPPTESSQGDEMGILEGDLDRLQDIALSAPVVNLVNRITQRAFDENATDIHIEPQTDRVQIRLRRDGLLTVLETAPRSMLAGIVSRIKILAKMNIVERRLPQDGRMRLSIKGEEVDFRVSVIPSAHGESLALRLLRSSGVSLDLAKLGYDDAPRRKIAALAEQPNGIVIITGPTGSGKTTTLYSLVSLVNRPEVKIFTVEDPVEYRIDGITQLQVNASLGLDFSNALRSILRQDPDVILVGEIRDRETAQIAIQAALTGHLVLTTLHTNSAAGALTRLADMGIEPYLISATVRGVVAQRLVRTYCACCKGTGMSCSSCGGTGYSGRTVVHEMLAIDNDLAAMINRGAAEAEIDAFGHAHGMVTLREHGQRLVSEGRTSTQEMLRVLGAGSET